MKITLDGNAYCVTTDRFTDLMASPAVFVAPGEPMFDELAASGGDQNKLTSPTFYGLYKQIYDQTDGECSNPGRTAYGIGPCRDCEVCECAAVLD